MLSKLIIKDIVLIKDLNLNFHEGVTVLTRQTGTGKSILIDSIGVISRSDIWKLLLFSIIFISKSGEPGYFFSGSKIYANLSLSESRTLLLK